MYSIVCGLTCIHDYSGPHEISAFTYFDTKKKAEFLSFTLGSALSTFCFSSFSQDFMIYGTSERLVMLQYSVFKAKNMQLEYRRVYRHHNGNKYPDGTQI